MSDSPTASFLFTTCQRGIEGVLKQEIARLGLPWNLAFSRPGFVSFKTLESEQEIKSSIEMATKRAIFSRTWTRSIGRVTGDTLKGQVAEVWTLVESLQAAAENFPNIQEIHVWERDKNIPGNRNFEPGPSALSLEIEAAIRKAAPEKFTQIEREKCSWDSPSAYNACVLDVVLVEPNQWYLGLHQVETRLQRWPGSIIPLELPEYAASRAYIKMQEALLWSAIPLSKGDEVIELGCAPGGASQALIETGVHVLGIDPGEVVESLLEDERFTHIRKRSLDVRRKDLFNASWLTTDLNQTPRYTLDAVGDIVNHPKINIRGLILTLKFTNWDLTKDLPTFISRVKEFGFKDIRIRQLCHNRQEICLVALRSRGQRRRSRGN